MPVGERVDPHHLADAARARGWVIQPQPALQTAGGLLPRTAHLTVTAVTLDVVDELAGALVAAADDVRGRVPASADPALMAAAAQLDPATLDAATAQALLAWPDSSPAARCPAELAPLMALIEQLPPGVTERLLTEFLARLIEP